MTGLRRCCLVVLSVVVALTVHSDAQESEIAGGPADTPSHFGESITVTTASRHREHAVDAPAAISQISGAEIERRAASSQVPKLIEHTPGLELTQSGLYDFNVNIRGFNGPLSRRVVVLIDGRDASIPFLGAQEWAAFSLPLDDLDTVEVVRGPSAALYGSNASSGVVNLVTRAPQSSVGGMLRLTAGELETFNLDTRWAGGAPRTGWWKLLAGRRSSGTFAVARRGAAEYAAPCPSSAACLPQEAAEPAATVEGWASSVRFDKDWGERSALTLEAGTSAVDGATVLTNLGRVTLDEVDRLWARARFSQPHWSSQATYNRRDAPRQTNLSSAGNLALDSDTWTLEAQTDRQLGATLRLVAGGALRRETIDSLDPATGAQTLLFEAVTDEVRALFAQLEWQASAHTKLFVAGRWDDSDRFFDDQISPRASLVWSPRPRHTLRLSYNAGFQAANYAEKLAQADVAAGLALQSHEELCAPFGVSCGFGGAATRRLAVGNPDLGIEKVRAFEVGYRALLGRNAFLTLDLYRSDNDEFITDLLPELVTPLGDINQFFAPYRPPPELPPAAAADLLAALERSLGPLAPLLTNNLDGDPFLALLTYGSFGAVSTHGAELAVRYAPTPRWTLFASTSTFEFDLERSLPGLDQILLPNAPRYQARASAAYTGERLSVELAGRWVDRFAWSSGAFTGDVPAYSTFDLAGSYRSSHRLTVALQVSNLFDNRHYEAFGGDLISRRALGSLTFRW